MRLFGALILAFIILSCDQVAPDNKKLETDRVWQYLKTYSIYTENLLDRDEAQLIENPYELAKSVWDTIRYLNTDYVFHFTYYDSSWQNVWDYNFPIDSIPRGRASVDTTIFESKLTDEILYLHIPRFSDLTYLEILNKKDIASQYENLIIDLRWNPGGLVDVCTLIVDLFLPNNTHYMNTIFRPENVSLTDEAKTDTVAWYSSTRDTDNWRNKKIAILMNQYSASASEILIEALRNDSVDCRLIGEQTFGKGIGQIHLSFLSTSGGGMSITTLKFLGIDNSTYHNKGIVPHIIINGDSTITDDNQLVAAAKYLDPTFLSNNYLNEILSISQEIQRRHDFSQIRFGDYYIKNFRPLAIVDKIFVED